MTEMQPVDSSNIDSVGYDAENKRLTIRFRTGKTYHYNGVDSGTFDEFMKAESKGKFLYQNIKGKYEFEKED